MDTLTPEMDLRQPGFKYSVCGPFTENKERIQNIKEPCFQHDMAYRDFKDLPRETASDNV